MNKFEPGRATSKDHASLKSALHDMEKAQQCTVIWFGEMMDRKLYRQFGYSTMNQYAETELGLSPSRTNDLIMLCRKLGEGRK